MNIYTQSDWLTACLAVAINGHSEVSSPTLLQLSEGLDKRSAIDNAARVLLRPILMT